jgi:hypothetical protein
MQRYEDGCTTRAILGRLLTRSLYLCLRLMDSDESPIHTGTVS